MQTAFGAGSLIGTATTDAYGNALAAPTPVQFGVLQNVSLDMSFDTKELYGQMVLTVAGLIWMGAQYAARVDDTIRRIGILEDRAQRRDDMLATIDARLARIEGRLDALRERSAR